MRNLFHAIAAVLRSMPRFVMQRIREGGRWISRLVASAAPPDAEPLMDLREPSSVEREDQQIRHVAGKLAQGLELEVADIKGMPEITVKWLMRMDRQALCRILATDQEQLRAHTRGRALIKGVPRHEKETVADAELEVLEQAPGEGKTLEMALAERGLAA